MKQYEIYLVDLEPAIGHEIKNIIMEMLVK